LEDGSPKTKIEILKPCRRFRRGFLHFNSAHFAENCTQSVQIQGIDNAFIVEDGIEMEYLNTITLLPLGLTY
jgi:hypothetical protein